MLSCLFQLRRMDCLRLTKEAVLFTTLALSLSTAACTAPNKEYCEYTGTCEAVFDLGANAGDLPNVRREDMSQKEDGGSPSFDPGQPGPYQTARFDIPVTVTGGMTRATVIGPSDDGKTLTARNAPFPLVIFSPSVMIDTGSYASYGERLASYGIITVLQQVPQQNVFNTPQYVTNTGELLNWLLSPTGMYAPQVQGRIDAQKVGLTGHSRGAKIGILEAAMDTRIKAYIGIDPVDDPMDPAQAVIAKIQLPPGMPMGFLGETVSEGGRMPCAPAMENFQVLYNKANPPAFATTFINAAHNDFIDGCTIQCVNVCPGGTAPLARTNSLAVKYVTAYFLFTLDAMPAAQSYFSGAAFELDVASGYVLGVSKN